MKTTLLIFIFIFNVSICNADIFVITNSTAKIYKTPNINNEYISVYQGAGYLIDSEYGNDFWVKIKCYNPEYSFVEKAVGIIKDDNQWEISKDAGTPVNTSDLQKYANTPNPSPSQYTYPKETKEFICREAIDQAMRFYYQNQSAFRDKPDINFWQREYQRCLNR